MQGFHAAPHDYSRRTKEGMKYLFRTFSKVSVTNGGGPTSGMLWVMQEWLAMVLSFGFKPLHTLWYLALMVLTFPIKYLDILLIKHPRAENISSGFWVVAQK